MNSSPSRGSEQRPAATGQSGPGLWRAVALASLVAWVVGCSRALTIPPSELPQALSNYHAAGWCSVASGNQTTTFTEACEPVVIVETNVCRLDESPRMSEEDCFLPVEGRLKDARVEGDRLVVGETEARRFRLDEIVFRIRCSRGSPEVRAVGNSTGVARVPSPEGDDPQRQELPNRVGLGMALAGPSLLYGFEVDVELFGALGLEAGGLAAPELGGVFGGARVFPWAVLGVRPFVGGFGAVVGGVHADTGDGSTAGGVGGRVGLAVEPGEHWEVRAEADVLRVLSANGVTKSQQRGWNAWGGGAIVYYF